MDALFTDVMKDMLGLYTSIFGYMIFLYGFQICLMLAVGFDCKAKGIKRQAMWMILTLLFPGIVAIIYACVRNGEEKENYKKCNTCGATLVDRVDYCAGCGSNEFTPCEVEKKQKYSKNSKTCLTFSIISIVVALICFGLFMFNTFSMAGNIGDSILSDSLIGGADNWSQEYEYESYHYGYEVDGKTVYYDREGKTYTDDTAVVYYDKNNNTYVFNDEEYEFTGSDGEAYMAGYSYVDVNGNFYFDAAGYENEANSTIYYSAMSDGCVDKDGNRYISALDASWDKDGNLVDFDGEYVLDEVTPTENSKEQ